MNDHDIDHLAWNKMEGLLPAIVQHAADGRILMLGYMNAAALRKTLESGRVTFFSRSRQALWTKGETSGHWLQLQALSADCDHDALLVQAVPHGPTCHTGAASCFSGAGEARNDFLSRLEQVILQRRGTDPQASYTASLLAQGVARCAQKVGEEGVETALAAVMGDADTLHAEAADLLYHLLVCLVAADTTLQPVIEVLRQRHGEGTLSGIIP